MQAMQVAGSASLTENATGVKTGVMCQTLLTVERWIKMVPRMGFDPMVSTLKGWRPNLARRPGHT